MAGNPYGCSSLSLVNGSHSLFNKEDVELYLAYWSIGLMEQWNDEWLI